MKRYAIILAGLLLALCIAPAAADDSVVGTWDVSGSIPFLFFQIPCADGTLTLNADGTGTATGSVNLLFIELYSMNNTPCSWEKVGTGKYQLTFPYPAVVNINYDTAAEQLSTTVNPSDYGSSIPFSIAGKAVRTA